MPPGGTTTFTVNAKGGALQFQWFRNNAALAGQTRSQLLLSGVTASVNGIYEVRVVNSAGLTNAFARFAVNVAPPITGTRNSSGDLVLTWNNPFFALQTAATLRGPWQTVENNSPFTVRAATLAANPEQYFRLVRLKWHGRPAREFQFTRAGRPCHYSVQGVREFAGKQWASFP